MVVPGRASNGKNSGDLRILALLQVLRIPKILLKRRPQCRALTCADARGPPACKLGGGWRGLVAVGTSSSGHGRVLSEKLHALALPHPN